MVQQQRPKNYDNKIQSYDYSPPEDAPHWTYIDQPHMVYDTEYEKTAEEDNDLKDIDEDEEF